MIKKILWGVTKVLLWILGGIAAITASVGFAIVMGIKKLWSLFGQLLLLCAGLLFPIGYTIINWEQLLARDLTSLIIVAIPIVAWKIQNAVNRKNNKPLIPTVAVMLVYVVPFILIFSVTRIVG